MFHEFLLREIALVKFHEIVCITNMAKRSYRLRRRAESQDRTRRKIVDAAVELHQEKGLAATSMNDIAKRAKVGKVTVYRHFPDETALVTACSGQYFRLHPFPDVETWQSIPDPLARLRRGLRDAYAYHRATEPMMERVLAEARDHPLMAPYHVHWDHAADILAEPWSRSTASAGRHGLLKAAIALALSFDTWRLLVRTRNLSDKQAIELMIRLTCDCPPKPA